MPWSLRPPKLGWKQSPGPAQSSPHPAVGGGHHPVLADEGAPAEVEAGAVLGEHGRVGAGWTSAAPAGPPPNVSPTRAESPPHLQGHLPGPGAGDSVLPIDDPGQATQHGLDGGDPAAWRVWPEEGQSLEASAEISISASAPPGQHRTHCHTLCPFGNPSRHPPAFGSGIPPPGSLLTRHPPKDAEGRLAPKSRTRTEQSHCLA